LLAFDARGVGLLVGSPGPLTGSVISATGDGVGDTGAGVPSTGASDESSKGAQVGVPVGGIGATVGGGIGGTVGGATGFRVNPPPVNLGEQSQIPPCAGSTTSSWINIPTSEWVRRWQ